MKLRKRKKKKMGKLLLLVLSCYLLYQLIAYILTDIRLVNGNEAFVKRMLQDSNYHLLYEKQERNVISKILKLVNQNSLEEPITILETSFAYNEDKSQPVFAYMNNPIDEKIRVYIYSTHQGEEYSGKGLSEYNISPGVMMASYILQDKLNSIGINTLVETRSVKDYLNQNNLPYTESYEATRYFLKTTLEQYPDLDLVIDLHRDALAKDLSTTTIDEKSYARILFVMNPNYDSNINLVKNINNTINKNYPGLSRGIYDKYRNTFNQDLHRKALLLEVGGQYNTIDEVMNTLDAVVEGIKNNI